MLPGTSEHTGRTCIFCLQCPQSTETDRGSSVYGNEQHWSANSGRRGPQQIEQAFIMIRRERLIPKFIRLMAAIRLHISVRAFAITKQQLRERDAVLVSMTRCVHFVFTFECYRRRCALLQCPLPSNKPKRMRGSNLRACAVWGEVSYRESTEVGWPLFSGTPVFDNDNDTDAPLVTI